MAGVFVSVHAYAQWPGLIFSEDISGVPGTGKTATVHAVVRELKRMAEHNVCPLPFLP